jgi:hypothetical protein
LAVAEAAGPTLATLTIAEPTALATRPAARGIAATEATAAAFAHPRLEALALFRRHLRQSFFHPFAALLRGHVRIESASATAASAEALTGLTATATGGLRATLLGGSGRSGTGSGTAVAAARTAFLRDRGIGLRTLLIGRVGLRCRGHAS